MVEIMTRFLGLGFTLAQVVTMSTANPAKAVGLEDRLGSLAVDRQADISVLDLREGDWVVKDVVGASLRVQKAFVPFVTVKRGRVFQPDWGPRPWGWEPDRMLPAGPIRGGCAAVLVKPRTLELREFPRPAVGPDDALLRIEACGICGSDYEQYEGHLPDTEDYRQFPVIPGHEPLGA
jgi:hypothetical protein